MSFQNAAQIWKKKDKADSWIENFPFLNVTRGDDNLHG